MERRTTTGWRWLAWLAWLAALLLVVGAACFPEFDRDSLADAHVCEYVCPSGMICQADGTCADPDAGGEGGD